MLVLLLIGRPTRTAAARFGSRSLLIGCGVKLANVADQTPLLLLTSSQCWHSAFDMEVLVIHEYQVRGSERITPTV